MSFCLGTSKQTLKKEPNPNAYVKKKKTGGLLLDSGYWIFVM